MSTETKTKYTAEPWEVVDHDGQTSGDSPKRYVFIPSRGSFRVDEPEHAAHIVACVNACAPMRDPAKAIEKARDALRALKAGMAHDAQISAEDMEYIATEALRALGG